MSALEKMLSSTEVHSIFVRTSDNALLISETGNEYYLWGETLVNASYKDMLAANEYYTSITVGRAWAIRNEEEASREFNGDYVNT